MKHLLLTSLSGLALAGCTVGPNYVAPTPPAPATTPFVEGGAPQFVQAAPPANWWHMFNSPTLDRLVDEALAANTDLRVAAANLRQARAVLREQRAGRLPTTSLSGQGGYARQSGTTLGLDGPGREGENYDIGADVAYQVDLFGGITRGIDAATADAEASKAAYDLARITVVAETTRAYADACSYGRRLIVARESLRVQEGTFSITERLEEGGRSTRLDVARAHAQLEQIRATLPTLEAERKASLYRLAVLTGKPPAEFPQDVADCDAIPTLAAAIPIGDGAGLLARRPDIRSAERKLAAATARVGVATANLYPSVSLGGSIGSTATSVDDLFSDKGFRFSLAGLISWNFPNMSVARSRLRQAEAAGDAALATFDGTWLNALQETESALGRYVGQLESVTALRRGREQAAEAARLARIRYEAGAESFQVVLDSEATLASIDASLTSAEAQLTDYAITLFLALGGGWDDADPLAPTPPASEPTASGTN